MPTTDPLIVTIADAIVDADTLTGDPMPTARAVYEAIAATGRLLNAGVVVVATTEAATGFTERTEHGYRYRLAHKNWTHVVPMLNAEEAAECVLDVLAIGAAEAEALVRHVYTGPWEVAQ